MKRLLLLLLISTSTSTFALDVFSTDNSYQNLPVSIVAGPTKEVCQERCEVHAKELTQLKFSVLKITTCSKRHITIDDWGRGNEVACKISFIR